MNIKTKTKQIIEKNTLLLWLKHHFLWLLHYIDFLLRHDKHEEKMAQGSQNPFYDCPDWWELEKISDAGRIVNNYLVMHNGIRVLPTAYQGYAHGKLIQRALGVHEPQEERLFRDIITKLPHGSIMIELGSYWAYYALWFKNTIPNARAIMVEPKLTHLNYSKRHFKINGFEGDFVQAGIGSEKSSSETFKITTVDSLKKQFCLDKISILHSDIQGYELEMLRGAEISLQSKQIDFLFISTHSDSLHYNCISFLQDLEYEIMDSYRICESWNPDGLILAKSPMFPNLDLKPAVKRSF